MHQAGPRVLVSVTHMFYVNQVCHGVGRCVKDGSCSLSSLSENQWTVLMGYYPTISTHVDAIKHITLYAVYILNCIKLIAVKSTQPVMKCYRFKIHLYNKQTKIQNYIFTIINVINKSLLAL